MSITAKLKVILKVDDGIVAESENPKLWQAVFDVIRKESYPEQDAPEDLLQDQDKKTREDDFKDPVQSFAKKIGVSKEILQSACSPSLESPYIHLDKHHWEALKKSLPTKGQYAVSPIAIAATVLSSWKEHIKESSPTVKEIQAVLATIDLYDDHPKRGIDNCEWLQNRNNGIVITPAQVTKATELIKAYCQKEASGFVQKAK